MTKAHNDRIVKDSSDKGYSIRIGKTLPTNSANLAYVHTEEMGPKQNLQIIDLSANIKENGLPSTYEKEHAMYPGEDFLLRELAGASKLPSKKIALTDEFSIPSSSQEIPVPLYYRAVAKGMFDAKGALVSPYLSGYVSNLPEKVVSYEKITADEKENLLYLGTKIKITNLDGTPINQEHKYKIHLVQLEGAGIPQNAYTVYIYTNFRNSDNETFILRYEKYNESGSHILDYTEILNAYPFFEHVEKYYLDEIATNIKVNGDWRSELNEKKYSVVETDDNAYEVYAPSQVLVANNTTRPAHQFKYRVKGNLKTRFSSANPGKINIGIAYLNTSVFNVEDLSSTLKKLYQDSYRPQYLEFINPFPIQKSLLKEDPMYWKIDISMPAEQWNEYDLVIITGYGYYDMSPYSDAIRNYLENGGKIWIDNAGEFEKALTFKSSLGKETFLTTVGFSATEESLGFKTINDNAESQELMSRLYVLSGQTVLGYENGTTRVNPKITFGSGEDASYWTTIVKYSNNNPSIIKRTLFGEGVVLVSNCGIFRSLFYSNDNNTKFAINILLSFVENKLIQGPWQQDYVYHRDNLFKEEYKGIGGNLVYVDERNDLDSSQIVSKKIINKTTRESLLSYVPSSYFNAKGTYEVEVQSNTSIPIINGSMEIGTYNQATGQATVEWTATTANAIPGWNAVHLAGATPKFSHLTSSSQRGAKAIQLEATTEIGSQSFWENKTGLLMGGSYRATVWAKVEGVNGITTSGMAIGIYNIDGTKIVTSNPIIGTQDWVELTVDFSIDTAKEVGIRAGFVDGNGVGIVTIDFLEVHSIGSVYMTPANNGDSSLYAYAIKPRGETFDLRAEGFSASDITTYDPQINVTYTIRAFVYAWDNYAGRYMRLYGNSVTQSKKIRRSDGIVNFGSLSTMLPPLNAGADWADKNDVYYEVYLGDGAAVDTDTQFVNIEIYNTKSGEYYFNKNGEIIIKYMDLFYEGENKNILLQARTNYYTVRATKRRYGVMVEPENKIELAYPSTIDNRDAWFLRIRNGSFTKKELNYNDIKELIAYDVRYYELQQRLFGTHYYSLPEYTRQIFKPAIGYKRVSMEMAEYIDDNTIKVQDSPMYIRQGKARRELVTKADSKGLVYKALNNEWDKTFIPRVYLDENMNGVEVEILAGFDIDYVNGLIIFESAVNGTVKVDYDYNNLEVWKRSYNNLRIRDEELESTDKKNFKSKNINWLAFPTPIVKIVAYENNEVKVAPVTSYTIDYSSGMVTFKEDTLDRVLVEYTFSIDKKLSIRDYDARNGYVYLEENIGFKDEIYVNYYYEENFLEYRGYYDKLIERFIHLDLNPSEGHYSTMPIVRTDTLTGITFTSWEPVPTAKLMNKEIYIYILPYKDSFGNYNEHAIRHCYSLVDWQSIQKTNPAAMILGVIHLREHTTIEEAIIMDARSRGGGLKETITEAEMKRRQPLSSSYWDMSTWDGKAYYKNGVLIIEIPRSVLNTEGGQFDEKQVKDIVRKHIAYGIYYIIEFV